MDVCSVVYLPASSASHMSRVTCSLAGCISGSDFLPPFYIFAQPPPWKRQISYKYYNMFTKSITLSNKVLYYYWLLLWIDFDRYLLQQKQCIKACIF